MRPPKKGSDNGRPSEKWPLKFTCQNAHTAGGWQVVTNTSMGAERRTFFLNDVNYVNLGSIVLSRSPDIIQLVFVIIIIIIMNVNDFYPDVRNVPDKNNGILIYILVFWDTVSRSYRSILYRLIRNKVTLVEYCEN